VEGGKGRREGRKEGRKGGKGKKEEGRRVTLPKGNFIVVSTKIRPLSLTFIKFFEQESL